MLQCRLHELNNKKRITVRAASKLLANTVSRYKGQGLSMVTCYSHRVHTTLAPPKHQHCYTQ